MISKIRASVRNALARRLGVPDIPPALERLAQNGFTPDLVFDVGAFRGEFALMALAIWPSARVACFEPLPYGREQINELRKRLPSIDLHETLVGSIEKAGVEMHVAKTSSSLLRDAHNETFQSRSSRRLRSTRRSGIPTQDARRICSSSTCRALNWKCSKAAKPHWAKCGGF
jgi:FkbM family methyltransferase